MRCSRSASPKTRACCPIRAALSSDTDCCRNTSAFRRSSSSRSLRTGPGLRRGFRQPRRSHSADYRRSSAAIAARCWSWAFPPRLSGSDCAPIVNLFPQTAEPILLSHARFEYPVVPDVNRRTAMEVFQINEVVSASPADAGSGEVRAVLFVPPSTPRAPRCRHSGTPRAVRPVSATTKARRSFCRWWISRARPVKPDVDTLTVRTSAPIAICRRGCPSATRRAISSSKGPALSNASWR